ncbi:RNA polymerase sigma-70 factor, ECF subfamily [Chitinophaga terrae (ex Kim and Jung 2007)]|uniref:RNA polymerase sigma-70 factor, ECF subfamily n=1 Tax=Chitinophaga terrae (ex Kim and Jung 2007) TaxID=408074 RepID=A0A1H4AV73_9BACT|nr:sigma-70 family RNA polymerase sigma factor [Chitinophaga terrae (ex Kim and Jung 2007)]MDQ0106764.1 RNA polymerase sigma-70 factor (ECF subfamily) [Chitinophaga terrae (ex Kim and Jung 2007)]GEP89138.1 DNA-directed RNA polymerase sigma-70 factor [Chitinophaga terrae (ex Kim and Jung 2007)]SEA39512.1 RNA polymerase sigma-70 factor, ECF subfamily [Chitinophaga terrae (ex Kim and Jung 2007)]
MSTIEAYGEFELINSFQRGERKALHQVYALYQRQLCFFTEQLIADTLAAEDIVSECFINAFQRKEDFPSLAQLKSFLFTAAKNAALNYLKAQKRHDDIHHSMGRVGEQFSMDVENAYIKTEVMQIIFLEIEKLPPQCRQVVRLSVLEGRSAPEIAEELKMAYQTVLNQKAKGMALLRTAILKNQLLSLPMLVSALMFLER